MKRLLISFTLLCVFSCSLSAQEFNCRVQINTQQASGTDKAVYDRFKSSVESFMNTQAWTNLQLSKNERLDCSLMFIFKSRKDDTFTCDFQIQLQRPVYNSSLMTSLLSMREELTFDYLENQSLTFNPTNINDNLIATLSFWSYVMLGLDFDSFSKLAGTPFYQKAQEIAGLAQGSLGELWKAQEDKNHWGWINALTSENQQQMRLLSYTYHRNGLDMMHKDVEGGRTAITQTLNVLKAVRQAKSGSVLLTNFIETKADELVNIYSKAEMEEKQQVFNLLNEVFPASGNRLQGIKANR